MRFRKEADVRRSIGSRGPRVKEGFEPDRPRRDQEYEDMEKGDEKRKNDRERVWLESWYVEVINNERKCPIRWLGWIA
jgi:hypothetical protein